MEDFKKSTEFAAFIKQQHLKSISENVKLYSDRGWLNIEKFRADREADLTAARLAKVEVVKAAKATRQREEEEEQADEDQVVHNQGEGSEDARDRCSTSVPKTPGISGARPLEPQCFVFLWIKNFFCKD